MFCSSLSTCFTLASISDFFWFFFFICVAPWCLENENSPQFCFMHPSSNFSQQLLDRMVWVSSNDGYLEECQFVIFLLCLFKDIIGELWVSLVQSVVLTLKVSCFFCSTSQRKHLDWWWETNSSEFGWLKYMIPCYLYNRLIYSWKQNVIYNWKQNVQLLEISNPWSTFTKSVQQVWKFCQLTS